MKLTTYYALFNRMKTGKFPVWGINLARIIRIRHLVIRMDTNFICNLRCKTCYFSGPKAKDLILPPMRLDFFKTIATDVFPKTRILFLSCGGEPLMTKGFEHFLEVTGQYSIPYVGYVTNGLLLTESIIQSGIENRINEITISIDGATKDAYEYIRASGNFDTLMSKLYMYKDIISKTKTIGPKLRFNFTVTRSNHHEMPLLVDLAKKFDVSVIKFRIFGDWGGQFSFEDESLIGYEMSFNKSLAEARKRASEAEIDLIAPKEFILDENKDLLKNRQVLENVPRPPCIYPWFHRYIDPKGRIRICANLPLSEEKLGDGYRLKDFENSAEEVRRRELLCKRPSQSCFELLCRESPLERPNDDVNFLE